MSLSNLYTYLFNQQLVMKIQVESHDKKPEDERNFYMWIIIGGISVFGRLLVN